jgi:hypothetical protein
MKNIISLFQRNYGTDRLVRDEIVPGAEWVVAGEGEPTVKIDGTSCLIKDGKLFKRYDRKCIQRVAKLEPHQAREYKAAPKDWIPCEEGPDEHTGHWPGWVPVGEGPDDKWHREAFSHCKAKVDGTYELIGPKVQGNPYRLSEHGLVQHGLWKFDGIVPRTFTGLKTWFESCTVEGIVWHHLDGRMVKIKRRDFGLPWPLPIVE